MHLKCVNWSMIHRRCKVLVIISDNQAYRNLYKNVGKYRIHLEKYRIGKMFPPELCCRYHRILSRYSMKKKKHNIMF